MDMAVTCRYNPHPFLHSGVHLSMHPRIPNFLMVPTNNESVDEWITSRNGFKAAQMHPANGYIDAYIDYICMDTLTT